MTLCFISCRNRCFQPSSGGRLATKVTYRDDVTSMSYKYINKETLLISLYGKGHTYTNVCHGERTFTSRGRTRSNSHTASWSEKSKVNEHFIMTFNLRYRGSPHVAIPVSSPLGCCAAAPNLGHPERVTQTSHPSY